MTALAEQGLRAWHALVEAPSEAALDAMLAADVVFHSPVVHSPQRGPALAKLYLMGAFRVLAGERPFRYVREIVGERDAALEFVTEIDGILVNGVDLIRWNDEGRIDDFKVLLRPLKAIQTVQAEMARMLETLKKG
jgi:hypothetical protein